MITTSGFEDSYTATISPFRSLAVERSCHSIRSFASASLTSVSSWVSTATIIYGHHIQNQRKKGGHFLCTYLCRASTATLDELTLELRADEYLSIIIKPHRSTHSASRRTRSGFSLRC